ncbi:facilitated trehalose transporter Tret1-like isoform X2 [Lycorma delicatula]|uniref:facilitated trehalose transporter Tret1-like isoform X2 n=1 Tax=Lycorma delicatula TaxID=130591 RepID=UPI003F5140A6
MVYAIGLKTHEPVMGYCKSKDDKNYKGIYRQYLAASAALLTAVIDGTLTGWPTPCLPLLLSAESPIPMTKSEVSWMLAMLFVGQTVSPIPTGYLMDWIGRKATMIYLAVLPIVAWLLVLFARDALMLSVAMFLAGLWIGTAYTVTPMYLGEIAEPSVRGRIVTLLSVITRIGIVLEIALGIFLPYYTLPLVSLIVPVLFILIFPWIPESPYFYLMHKDRESASKALCWLRGDLTKDEVEEELSELEESVNRQMKEKGRFIDLVNTRGNRKALITVETLAILQRLSGMGPVMGYISTTLPANSFNYFTPAVCVIIIDSVRLVSGLISSFLVDFIGRRTLLIATAIFCGLMMYFTGTWFYFNSMTNIDVSWISWTPFVCLVMHGLSFSLGLGPVCSAIRSEYFPMNIKAKSSAVTSTVLAFASFIINKTYLTTGESLGMHVNYWVYGTSCFSIGLFTWWFLIETKGKSLQQIQDELNRNTTTNTKETPEVIINRD